MISSALLSPVGIIQCSTIMTAVDCRQSTKTGPKMFSLHKSVQPGRFLIKNVWKFIFWSKDLVKNNWKYRIFFTLQNDFLAITSFPHTSVKIIILLLNRYRSRAKYKAIKLFTEVWGKKVMAKKPIFGHFWTFFSRNSKFWRQHLSQHKTLCTFPKFHQNRRWSIFSSGYPTYCPKITKIKTKFRNFEHIYKLFIF